MKTLFPYLAALVAGFALSTCNPPSPEGPVDICHTTLGYHIGGNATTDVTLVAGQYIKMFFKTWDDGFVSAIPTGIEMLDASGNGFPEALTEGTEIGPDGIWGEWEGFLSTPDGQGGQFKGAGIRYLGFRIPASNNGHRYGWFKLECNQDGTELFIHDFAIKQIDNQLIIAGEVDAEQNCPPYPEGLVKSAQDIIGNYRSTPNQPADQCVMEIRESDDPIYDFTVKFYPLTSWPSPEKIYGKIVNGRLVLPFTKWSGLVTSPPGTSYEGSICGYGDLHMQEQQALIVWQLNYDQTGFYPGSYHSFFHMYKCE
ncbi:MAG: hypothetical protein WA004_19410 [Saprospiraceae bacterium]